MAARQKQVASDGWPEEARMLERARADPADFAPLYERYFPRIYAYCLRRTGMIEEAEDLTSLVFTRALAGLKDYRGGSVAAWLFRIAHNAVANHLRGRQSQIPFETAALTTVEDSAESGEQVLERLVLAEERQRVTRLIAALPDRQRELLALTVAGGLSAKEIGAVLGKSEGAVWTALHRIVRRLHAAYRDTEEAHQERQR